MLPLTQLTGQAAAQDSSGSFSSPADTACAAGASPLQQPYMIGAPAPHYQPSLLPKGRVMALQTDRGLQPSPPEALDDVLRDLKMDRRTLEVISVTSCLGLQKQLEPPGGVAVCWRHQQPSLWLPSVLPTMEHSLASLFRPPPLPVFASHSA